MCLSVCGSHSLGVRLSVCPDVCGALVFLLSGWLLVVAVCPIPSQKCVKRLAWPVALLPGLGGSLPAAQSHLLVPGSPTWTFFTPSAVPQHHKTRQWQQILHPASGSDRGRFAGRWSWVLTTECWWVNGSGGMSNKGSLLHPTLT